MRKGIVLFLILVSNISVAQFSLNQGSADRKDYFISLPYENIAGKIIIPVTINAHSYRFLLDTGSPVVLSQALYELLKPSVIKRISLTDQSGKRDSSSVVLLEKIMLGDVTFTNTPSVVSDNVYIFGCLKIDGIVGSNLLRNSIVQFSSRTKTIIITNDNSKVNLTKKQSSPLMLDKMQSTPIISILLQSARTGKNVREQLVFDSGDDNFYILATKHFKAFQAYQVFDTVAQGFGTNSYGFNGLANDTTDYRLAVGKIIVNGAAFVNTRLSTTLDENSRIGSTIIDYGTVTLDYKNKRFYFDPFLPTSDLKAETADFNVSPGFDNGKIVIGIIWDPELRHKLKHGEEVISINGILSETIDPCDILTRNTPFAHETKLTLKVKHENGEMSDVVIVKE